MGRYPINRRIPKDCTKCQGTGIQLYSNTATFRSKPGMVSGCAMTTDICNKCWGTGSETYPGYNILELFEEIISLKKRLSKHEDV